MLPTEGWWWVVHMHGPLESLGSNWGYLESHYSLVTVNKERKASLEGKIKRDQRPSQGLSLRQGVLCSHPRGCLNQGVSAPKWECKCLEPPLETTVIVNRDRDHSRVFLSTKLQTLPHPYHKPIPKASESRGQVSHSKNPTPISCISALFLWQNTWWRQLREGRVGSGSQCEGAQSVMATGAWSSWSHRIQGEETERDECQLQITFSFLFSLRPQSMGVLPTF